MLARTFVETYYRYLLRRTVGVCSDSCPPLTNHTNALYILANGCKLLGLRGTMVILASMDQVHSSCIIPPCIPALRRLTVRYVAEQDDVDERSPSSRGRYVMVPAGPGGIPVSYWLSSCDEKGPKHGSQLEKSNQAREAPVEAMT